MEFSSFDAPSLPPPGGEPAPTLPAGLTAPTLPAPSTTGSRPAPSAAAPTLPPPPSAAEPSPDPSAFAPTLPPPGTAESRPVTSALPSPDGTAGPVPGPLSPEVAQEPGPASSEGRRSRRGLALAAVAALAVAGLATWQLTSGDDDAGPAPTTGDEADAPATVGAPEAPASSREVDATIGAIGADAIGDARELVDELEDRGDTGELLAELGLGPDGEPVPDPPVLDEPAGYAFVWTDPTGDRVGALVDAIDGDYAIEGSDGIAVRVVDGVPYTRSGGEWQVTDLSVLGPRPVPALDGFPTIERVIHEGIAPHVRDRATTTSAEGTTFAFLVDDSALFAADPAARDAWLLPWGLLDGHRPPAVADAAELTDARDDAGPGQVVFAFTVSPAGELVTVTVASPAIGGVGVLDQIGTSAEPPTIEPAD